MTEMIRCIIPVDGRLCAERPAARQVEIETGTVFMNRCDYLDRSSPGPASTTRPRSDAVRASATKR